MTAQNFATIALAAVEAEDIALADAIVARALAELSASDFALFEELTG